MRDDMEGKAYLRFHNEKLDTQKRMLSSLGFEVPQNEYPFRINISRIYGVNNENPEDGDEEIPGVSVEISCIDTGVLNGRNMAEYICATPKNRINVTVYRKHLESLDKILAWFKSFEVDAFSEPGIDSEELDGVYTETIEAQD